MTLVAFSLSPILHTDGVFTVNLLGPCRSPTAAQGMTDCTWQSIEIGFSPISFILDHAINFETPTLKEWLFELLRQNASHMSTRLAHESESALLQSMTPSQLAAVICVLRIGPCFNSPCHSVCWQDMSWLALVAASAPASRPMAQAN